MPAIAPILAQLAKEILKMLLEPQKLSDGTPPPNAVPEPVTPPTPTNPPPPPKKDPPAITLPPPPNNPFTYKPDPNGNPLFVVGFSSSIALMLVSFSSR
jgi:hypothetical protein